MIYLSTLGAYWNEYGIKTFVERDDDNVHFYRVINNVFLKSWKVNCIKGELPPQPKICMFCALSQNF